MTHRSTSGPIDVTFTDEEIIADLVYPGARGGGPVSATIAPPGALAGATRTRTITWQDPMASAAAGAELNGDRLHAQAGGRRAAAAADRGAAEHAAGRDRARATRSSRARPGEEHYNPIGVVHGGYAATLLDSALGCAVHTTLDRGEAYTTLTLEVKMVRPITADVELVRAEAEVLYRGRRQATAQAKLIDAATGKLLAHGDGDLHDPRRLAGLVERQADQQPDAEAAGALADVLAPRVPGGAGDVEVGPRHVVHELLEERARVDRPGLALRRRRS